MTDDIDVWCSVNLYMKHYGDELAIQAAMQVSRLMNQGGPDGAHVRGCILWAIKGL